MKTLLAVAAVTLSLGTAAGAGSVVRKCSDIAVLFPDAPEPVFVLNARTVSEEELAKVDPGTIESAHVMCAPELHKRFRIRAQRSAYVVFTAPGPTTELRNAFAEIDRLQARHLRDHGRYAANIEALGWSDASGRITITLSTSDDGRRWAATGSHAYLPEGSELTIPDTE